MRAPFGNVPGPLPVKRTDTAREMPPTHEQERGMRAFWWDGFWSSASDSIALNYLPLFVLAFGASNSQVGWLSSLTSLAGAAAFLPGARAAEFFGRRKATVLLSGGGMSRLPLVALAMIPLLMSGQQAVWVIIAIACFRGFWGQFGAPAWTSLTADVVPLDVRGRFLASRSFGASLAALVTAPLAGFLLDRYTGIAGWQIVWVGAFAAGAMSTWYYARIPEPAPPPRRARGRQAGRARAPGILADRNFTIFLASVAVWNIGLQVSGPFFNVYLVSRLHASTAWVGFLAALPSFTGLLGIPVFGSLMDRRGTHLLMVTTGLLVPLLPLAWVGVNAPWQVIFINVASGVIWAGYHLSNTNAVMVMAPRSERANYTAVFQTVTFISSFVGPIVGGYLIDLLDFHATFVLSAVVRLAGVLILLRFVRIPHRTAHA